MKKKQPLLETFKRIGGKLNEYVPTDSEEYDERLDIEDVIQDTLSNIIEPTRTRPTIETQQKLDKFMALLNQWNISLNVAVDSTPSEIDSEIKHSDWSGFDEADAEELQQDIDKL